MTTEKMSGAPRTVGDERRAPEWNNADQSPRYPHYKQMSISQGSWLVYLLLAGLIVSVLAVGYFSMAEPTKAAPFTVVKTCQALDLGSDGTIDVLTCPEGVVFALSPFGGSP